MFQERQGRRLRTRCLQKGRYKQEGEDEENLHNEEVTICVIAWDCYRDTEGDSDKQDMYQAFVNEEIVKHLDRKNPEKKLLLKFNA